MILDVLHKMKKQLQVIVLLVSFLPGVCDDRTLEIFSDQLENIDGVMHYMGLPFSGIVHGGHNIWKDTVSIAEYDNGLLNGKVINSYFSGEKIQEKTYHHGKLHGPFIEWHKNGQKKTEIHYDNDMIIGEITEWDEKGCIIDKYIPESFSQRELQKNEERIESINPDWKEVKIIRMKIPEDAIFIPGFLPIKLNEPIDISEIDTEEQSYGTIEIEVLVNKEGRADDFGPLFFLRSKNVSMLVNKIRSWTFEPLFILNKRRRAYVSILCDFDSRTKKTYIRQKHPHDFKWIPIRYVYVTTSIREKWKNIPLVFSGETDVYGRVKNIWFSPGFPKKLAKMSKNAFVQWVFEPYIVSAVPMPLDFLAIIQYHSNIDIPPLIKTYYFISEDDYKNMRCTEKELMNWSAEQNRCTPTAYRGG